MGRAAYTSISGTPRQDLQSVCDSFSVRGKAKLSLLASVSKNSLCHIFSLIIQTKSEFVPSIYTVWGPLHHLF